MLWYIEFASGEEIQVEAPTCADAAALAHRRVPGAILIEVSAVPAWYALELAYGNLWEDLLARVIRPDSPAPGVWSDHDWLALVPTRALDADGTIRPTGIADYRHRHLHRLWGNIPSVRFDGGLVRIQAFGAAPANLIAVVNHYLRGDGPLDASPTAPCAPN